MSSCFSLTVLPGPARLLLNKICIPLLRALYDVIPSKGAGQNLQSCNFYSRDKLREVEGINSCLNLFLLLCICKILIRSSASTERLIKVCTWLKNSSCSCLIVLPEWVLLSKTYKPLFTPLYISSLSL